MQKLRFMAILMLILGLVLIGCDNNQMFSTPGTGDNGNTNTGTNTGSGTNTPGGGSENPDGGVTPGPNPIEPPQPQGKPVSFATIDPEIGDEAKIVIGYTEQQTKAVKNAPVEYAEGMSLVTDFSQYTQTDKEYYTATELGLTPVYVTSLEKVPSNITKICVGGGDFWYEINTPNRPTFPTITEAYIAPGASRIGDLAFYCCVGLKEISIPDGITSIGGGAFGGCVSLTGAINIPEGVTSIGTQAFMACSSLTSISIPSSVAYLGMGAFSGCSSLTGSITIPEGVPSIGDHTFFECSGLTSITIGNGVTSIGQNAFMRCRSLTTITIPESVTSLGSAIFIDCTNLKGVTFKDPNRWRYGDEYGPFIDSTKLSDPSEALELLLHSNGSQSWTKN